MNIFVVVTALTLVLCQFAFADEIKIEGGGTAIHTVFRPVQDRFEKYQGHHLSIVESSAVKGLIDLQDGKVDIATGAHPLEDLIAGAAKEGVTIDKSSLVATQMEENRLVVIANRSSAVTRLSKKQLKDVFTGTITNWKEVGGSELPITVVWGKETKGQNIQFTRIALDGGPVTSGIRSVSTYRNIAQTVGEVPGGIGVVPIGMTTPATRSIDTISITSPIYTITKGEPSEKVQDLLEFYKREYGFLK